ncbi:MAG: TIGR02186 family protein [Syntrophobacteraceae bacterium]
MKLRLFSMLWVLFLCSAPAAGAKGEIGLSVEPHAIAIGTFYDGTTLTVSGRIPQESQAVIQFIGDRAEVFMKQKAKVGGLVWMNTGSVVFKETPSVFIVFSALDLKKLGENSGGAEGLRLASLKKTILVDAKGSGDADIVEEFIKLKQREGLYRELTGHITYGKATDGLKTFRAVIPIPSRLKPGDYSVEVAALGKGAAVAARERQMVAARLEGLPALMAALAFNHSILYGIFATLIALFAGLGIGLVFQSKGAH